ncbi:hypothetical protein QWJ26_34650 [Streptomyces sp. CSDS2]|uniref:hypothetical protein n=1 Tax=Streptomyces sp. CSDS2 TaxID=3055051 RepID=UPI0025B2266B|nr:hypothetical protein [Streptomyces sp. CSDS2]MDN3264852.1 hypothetical protein [Streptomyces sp. CSDS2]
MADNDSSSSWCTRRTPINKALPGAAVDGISQRMLTVTLRQDASRGHGTGRLIGRTSPGAAAAGGGC